jgi:hypothetical protein
MLKIENSVEELSGLDPAALPDAVLSSTRPLLLRGLVAHWPLVQAGLQSADAAMDYLKRFYQDATVGVLVGGPEIQGRIFYNEDLTGFNFQRRMTKLDVVLEALAKAQADENAPTVYLGSTTIDTCLPGFRGENDLALTAVAPLASIWLGNRTRIAAHYDVPDNLACVAAGRRRFTLFPPDQLTNLYVGPLDFTPAGQAISMVDFAQPDFERYPKFKVALRHAQVADMNPGDAIFIPSMWWHHVEGLDAFNVLINYWWRRSPGHMGTPDSVLLHALLSLRDLPAEQREAWRGIFNHYVFEPDEDAVRHIPERSRGVLAPLGDAAARGLRALLLNRLNR